VVGFVGWSGVGKTTLLTAVLPILGAAGLRAGVLKHAHHGFDIDRPGKDSYRAREAGASRVLVASSTRWALMGEMAAGAVEPPFAALVARLAQEPLDLILAEGFASERYPKIEVHRAECRALPKCWPHDPDLIAIATDTDLPLTAPVCRLDLNRPAEVADFILDTTGLRRVEWRVAHAG